MNINKTPEITFNGIKTVLWNFSLRKYPKALHSLVTQELETAHGLVEQFNRASTDAKRQELFDQIIFYHNYLSATHLQRQHAAQIIGMSKDDIRENDSARKRQLQDANAFAVSYDQTFHLENSDIASSSAHIAHKLAEKKAERSRQGRQNRQNKKNKQSSTSIIDDQTKEKKREKE